MVDFAKLLRDKKAGMTAPLRTRVRAAADPAPNAAMRDAMARRGPAHQQPEQPEVDLPLITKYRPTALDAMVGQAAVTKSLAELLRKPTRPHSYLFTGPGGTGKTTLARIVAAACGVATTGIVEVDAASNSGVDEMRVLMQPLRYQGMGEKPNKMVIIDEAHRLSKNAWDVLLKPMEEPPAHVYFALCTSEGSKVPATIRTRCAAYDLKPVRRDDLLDLLEMVCTKEELDTPAKHLGMVADAADGSPRQALSMLQAVQGATTDQDVQDLLQYAGENAEVIDLARMLVQEKLTWGKLCATLKALTEPAETVRIIITAYLTSCALGARTDDQAGRLMDMIAAFSKPCNATDKMAPLLLAFATVMDL